MSQDTASIPAKSAPDKYSDKEAQQRFEAALRGARLTGHKQMKDLPKKQRKAAPKKKTKVKESSDPCA